MELKQTTDFYFMLQVIRPEEFNLYEFTFYLNLKILNPFRELLITEVLLHNMPTAIPTNLFLFQTTNSILNRQIVGNILYPHCQLVNLSQTSVGR
jgi:hypothetical protein